VLKVIKTFNLKGKFGVNPTRSRHCNGELFIRVHCFKLKWEGIRSEEPKSGDLPIVCAYYLREIGRSGGQMLKIRTRFNSS
jgi:hypothetical protein